LRLDNTRARVFAYFPAAFARIKRKSIPDTYARNEISRGVFIGIKFSHWIPRQVAERRELAVLDAGSPARDIVALAGCGSIFRIIGASFPFSICARYPAIRSRR